MKVTENKIKLNSENVLLLFIGGFLWLMIYRKSGVQKLERVQQEYLYVIDAILNLMLYLLDKIR